MIVRDFNITFYGLNGEFHQESHVSVCQICEVIADPPFRVNQIVIARCIPYQPVKVNK